MQINLNSMLPVISDEYLPTFFPPLHSDLNRVSRRSLILIMPSIGQTGIIGIIVLCNDIAISENDNAILPFCLLLFQLDIKKIKNNR